MDYSIKVSPQESAKIQQEMFDRGWHRGYSNPYYGISYTKTPHLCFNTDDKNMDSCHLARGKLVSYEEFLTLIGEKKMDKLCVKVTKELNKCFQQMMLDMKWIGHGNPDLKQPCYLDYKYLACDFRYKTFCGHHVTSIESGTLITLDRLVELLEEGKEPTIKIGEYEVEFSQKGDIRVGCQDIDRQTILKIVKESDRLHKEYTIARIVYSS